MNDLVRYELWDGRRAVFHRKAIELIGLNALLKQYGFDLPDGRVPVFQNGIVVGTLPAAFDPENVRSLNVMYQPRRSDIVQTEKGWLASPLLGQGDLMAILEFASA